MCAVRFCVSVPTVFNLIEFGIDKSKQHCIFFNVTSTSSNHPLLALTPEDLDLITALVLHSGSIKDLAAEYGVSYPTIRQRLDRVIERLREVKAGRKPDPFSELLASLVERGELSATSARTLRDTARQHYGLTQP